MKITRGQLHDLVARSAVDKPKFREMLIADPKLMLERTLGHGLGKITVKAVVETPDTMYLVVPCATTDGELSDSELDHIATGILDNMAAACNVSGGLNLLSSRVAIDVG